jgi:hypothetical protein
MEGEWNASTERGIKEFVLEISGKNNCEVGR